MAVELGHIKYLFRYRDLVALTVGEHQRIIKERGAAWWGWWKRPSEDSRQEVWEDLKQAVAGGTPQSVGLFDSGSGKVFRATVTDVILPDATGDVSHPVDTVPAEERDLIPEYYRSSPFSRAWMKLSQIEGPCSFFGEYSLAEAPRLANYSQTTLDKLRGKVLLERDELTGMDTTIWHVRPSRLEDHRDKVILTVPALPGAVSAEVVRCKSDKILHITDLHFATGVHRDQHAWRLESEPGSGASMVDALALALTGQTIGLVIVTGDLTFLGSADEFREAATALRKLLGILDLSTDHLIVVPGNHDIQWRKSGDLYKDGAKVERAAPEARRNYETFYTDLFRHPPSPYLAMGRRYLFPSGFALEVCALNSSTLKTGKNFLAGMGRIDESSFGIVAAELGWKNGSTAALRLLAIHHHLALTEDLEPERGFAQGYGLAVDAVRVQRMAAGFGVQLALHGHKHRSFIWRSSVYELPERTKPQHKLGELSIVGGGSAGSTETDSATNYFNTLDLAVDGVLLTIHSAQNQGVFQPMQAWCAPLQLQRERQRLELDDWELAVVKGSP